MVRSKEEQELLRKSGLITAQVLKELIKSAKPGLTLKDLEKIAVDELQKRDAGASFKTVPGYFWATCLTINDEVVHGIPRDIILKAGDILKIDLGAVYKGWHTDAAWTVIVKNEESRIKNQAADNSKEKFLRVGEEVLWKSLKMAVDGKRIGDISSSIQEGIEKAGYSVVKSLAGHGVGRHPHEEPEIPLYGKAGKGMILKEGMSIAIEVIYTEGKGDIYQKDDGWTLASSDGSLGGLFEMSVLVGKKKPEILTDITCNLRLDLVK